MLDPFDEIRRMHEEIDKMFYRAFRGGADAPLMKGMQALEPYKDARIPVADCRETEGSVIASIELPGVEKKDIKLNISDDAIEVKVEKKHEAETKEKRVYKYESSSRQFYRRLPLPANVDSSKASAEYNNGMLRIEVPKLQISDKRRQIEIK
jgi:HSP20 family protein